MITTPTEVVGWASTAVLLATISRQVYSQWKSKATAGVSRWLFVGQISASIGFICYSYQLHNWVFLFSNSAMLITAIMGEVIYISNRKGGERSKRRAADLNAGSMRSLSRAPNSLLSSSPEITSRSSNR